MSSPPLAHHGREVAVGVAAHLHAHRLLRALHHLLVHPGQSIDASQNRDGIMGHAWRMKKNHRVSPEGRR